MERVEEARVEQAQDSEEEQEAGGRPIIHKPTAKPSLQKSPKEANENTAAAAMAKKPKMVLTIEPSRAGKEPPAAALKLRASKGPLVKPQGWPEGGEPKQERSAKSLDKLEQLCAQQNILSRYHYEAGFWDGLLLGAAVCATTYLAIKFLWGDGFNLFASSIPQAVLQAPVVESPLSLASEPELVLSGSGPLASALRSASRAKL